MHKKTNIRIRGQLSLQAIIFSAVAVIIISGFAFLAVSFLKLSVRSMNKASAFAIAEAGIEYYRWHLAHNPTDYKDGTGAPGPYAHDYFDKNGTKIGGFSLEITPPSSGSTIVKIKSTGTVLADESIEKIIEVQLGVNSLTRYAVLANDDLHFGSGTITYGPIHSNGGVHFDGIAYNTVYSAQSTYFDDEDNKTAYGVHTNAPPAADPEPPAPLPSRPDVFPAGRTFPVPAVDFTGITATLANIKGDAQASGLYLGSSTASGYHIVLKTDDTLDLYRVTSIFPSPPSCNNSKGQDGWGTWSINTETFIQNYPFPANGLVFVEDDLWVSGQINSARLTIAAGLFPENSQTYKNIVINDDILYTNYDGQDVLGLIAQNNVNIGLKSEDDLRIDAGMVAKNGRVGRYYYRPPQQQGQGNQGCQEWNVRNSITTYGILASNHNYGFSYEDGTGFLYAYLNYDPSMVYNPPPSFPLVGDLYVQISWKEVK